MARLSGLAGTAAVVLLACGSAQAAGVTYHNRSTAVIGIGVGYLNSDLTNPGRNQDVDDVPLNDAEAFLVALDGFYNGWLSSNFAVQFDFNAQASTALAYDPDYPSYGQWLNGATHIAYRDPSTFAVAGFVAAQSSTYASYWGGSSVAYAVTGLEGQVYLDNLTLYGQGGVALTRPAESGEYDYRDYGQFAFVRGVVRYFLTDNFKLSAEATYGEGNIGYYTYDGPGQHQGGEVSTKLAMVKIAADYRPDDSDASFFAAYEASYLTQSWSDVTRSSLDQRVTARVKIDFGAETLKSRDREGVTWDVPNITGAIGQSGNADFCFIGDCWYPLDPTP